MNNYSQFKKCAKFCGCILEVITDGISKKLQQEGNKFAVNEQITMMCFASKQGY